ncbi:MAG: hypothetical protein IT294_13110 [Deltaproteobacteria bacterium]|nr:hypothetical protein [Deltaproteobacteria bacterium]
MSGVLGSHPSGAPAGTPGLSPRLRGPHHRLRPHTIGDFRHLEERLDASLVPADRSRFELAIRRSLGNWMFFVPGTIGVLWLSTVIVDLAIVTSVLLSVLVLAAAVPAAIALALAAPRVVARIFTRHGRAGYVWFLATTVMEALDCGVYGTCLFLLARAGGFAPSLPSLPF